MLAEGRRLTALLNDFLDLQRLESGRQPIVLLDIQMPGRSGLELVRAIRVDPELASTRVVLLTSKAREADVRAGLEAGADRYLTKPFSPLDLLRLVDRIGARG